MSPRPHGIWKRDCWPLKISPKCAPMDQQPKQADQFRLFQELRPEQSTPFDDLPDQINCYVSKIQPQHCGMVVKELGYLLPLRKIDGKGRTIGRDGDEAKNGQEGDGDEYGELLVHRPILGHLRRVRRIVLLEPPQFQEKKELSPKTNDPKEEEEPPKKRKRKSK